MGDMAMLGLIHRTVLGKGPEQFQRLFQREAGTTVKDPGNDIGGSIVKRSALGLVKVYNTLHDELKAMKTVKAFQGALQDQMKERAQGGAEDWSTMYSPR